MFSTASGTRQHDTFVTTLYIQTEDALALSTFEEFAQATANKIDHSTSPLTAPQAAHSECLEHEVRSVSPANFKRQCQTNVFH